MHRLSNISEDGTTADCAACGPTRVYASRSAHRKPFYVCATKQKAASKRKWLKRQYGMTEEEYDAKLEAQGGVCAICEQPQYQFALAVDHCHVTGKNRSLLCVSCNVVLGHTRDKPEMLHRMLAYLAEHQ